MSPKAGCVRASRTCVAARKFREILAGGVLDGLLEQSQRHPRWRDRRLEPDATIPARPRFQLFGL
jgi:hypothetical protein